MIITAKQEWVRSDKTVIEYDDDMFELASQGTCRYLHFKDTYVGPISLPEGLYNLNMMFKDCNIKPGCYFDNFDTKNVTNVRSMFQNCSLPDGFTLGDKFDTQNVKYMGGMFQNCSLPDDFTLGDKFDTCNAVSTYSMFRGSRLPEGFTLGDKFDTSKSTNMIAMFENAVVADDFTLGDKFNTQSLSVDYMLYMFKNSNISNDIISRSNIDMDKLKEANVLGVKIDSMQDEFDKLSIDLQHETNADKPVYISLLDKLNVLREFENADEPYISLQDKFKILRESEKSEKTEFKKLSAFEKMKSEKNKMDRDSDFNSDKGRSIVD